MSDFSIKDMQFFPTPAELASRMWGKFKNKDIQRMLEPSCGNGDLVRKMPDRRVHRHGEQFSEVAIERRGFATDACELDVTKHPVLKALAHELTDKLRKSATIDWQKRDTARARMRLLVKVLLTKYKYPPDKQPEAVEKVIEQAELYADLWAVEGA